jgi:pSer/pThr/pTyr-binding forkhead associated (FHA) protein
VNDEKIPTAPEATKSGPVGNLLTTLIGMGVVAAVAWYILKYMRENGDKVQDTLKKLGADLPQAPATDPDPAPITPIKPEPMQQIILDSAPVAPVAPTPTPMGTPRLIATDGSAFDLPEGETTVGREFGNGLVVPSDTVSRRHASLLKSGSTVSVTDHGSTNGSWVNGMKVGGTVSLNPGDQVRFGSIEYQYEG